MKEGVWEMEKEENKMQQVTNRDLAGFIP